MRLEIRRSPQASIDGLEVWLHIAADNLTAADAVMERIDEAIEKLGRHPELGPERPNLGRGIRMFPVDSTNIFYRVTPEWLEIVRILPAARNVTPDLLSE